MLYVGGLAEEVDQKVLQAAFIPFGDIVEVNMPIDYETEKHRGFAFIEFSAVSDAKTAFKSLVHSTHLYGRRLVLEWAQGEETLEELRDKTRKHWGDGGVVNSKRTKFDFEKD